MQLNFFPISFSFDEYDLNFIPYADNKLEELRLQHNTTHSFFRVNERIYISNNSTGATEIGSTIREHLYKSEKVTSALIKHVFFRTFKERFRDYIPVDFYPFRFFSKQEKDDLIYSVLPNDLKGTIAYKKLIEVQLRKTIVESQIRYGFVINIKRNWVFSKNCSQLNQENFNLLGLDVLKIENLPGLAGVLAADEEFVGVIKEMRDNQALVATSEGDKLFLLDQLTLKKSKYNMAAYLSFTLSEQESKRILSLIDARKHELYDAQTLNNEILSIARSLFYAKDQNGLFSQVNFQNKDGFCFTVDGNMLKVSNSMELKTPTFIFDYAATKTHSKSADLGLLNYGPYDSSTFEPKSPLLLCIGHKESRGRFSNFIGDLINGIPTSSFFKKGLQKKYEFRQISIDIQDIRDFSYDQYEEVIRKQDSQKPDLAIIEIPFDFKALRDDQNPYFRIKAKLLQLEIPVQFVTSPNIQKYNEYILNSIALQIYAKLGGTPWVLPSSRSVDREIVIGIGHSWSRDSSFKGAAYDRVVGITTFMSSDGQYLLGDKAKDVPFDKYFEELLHSLKTSFDRLEREYAWAEHDTIRLIFHIFKPIKNLEFEVVCELMKQYSKYSIQFAFVTISKHHPLKMFDPNQRGVLTYTNKIKGAYIPERSTNLFIDSTTALVQMFGAKELKTEKHGLSNPIQIKIRMPDMMNGNESVERLLFIDLEYVVQQLFSFTYLSWRSFLPAEQPATMLYANLISKLLGKMRRVPGWDPDSLNYKLKRKKWFL